MKPLDVSLNDLFNITLSVFKMVSQAPQVLVKGMMPASDDKANWVLTFEEHLHYPPRVTNVVHEVWGNVYVRQIPSTSLFPMNALYIW